MSLLDVVASPEELRKLPASDLTLLAQDLRSFLIQSVNETGGHLGAGLGVVELTIALHRVFNTPADRVIWDVGHQCYPHKILTGRKDHMTSLRQTDGLCGFPSREESPFDAFGTGHSSTSISAALGMAIAAKAKGESRQAIAVIGDGAMTAGQAFEALNHAATLQANLLVILNDNEMSISPSVGMLSHYLKGMQGADDNDHLFSPLASHGLDITGPIDGHDLPELLKTLERLKNTPGPRLLHVVTRKGKGLPEAEADPVGYHAVAKINSKAAPGPVSWSNRFGEWMCAKAARDSRIFAITPAMREGSDLVAFAEQYPQRYLDVAIAEQHAVTLAAGLACEGVKPVLAIYSTFLQRGYDQLIHDVALQNLDLLFAIDRAGLVGEDGPTHHGVYDIAFLRAIPNMVVMAPSDEQELTQMLEYGYEYSGPAAVRYPRGSALPPAVSGRDYDIGLGKGRILRTGKRAALVAFGPLTHSAYEVAEQLDLTLADMRFIKPLDEHMLQTLAENHELMVTLEEGSVTGGVGEQIAALLQDSPARVVSLGVPDHFISHGNLPDQLQTCGLTTEQIAETVKEQLQ